MRVRAAGFLLLLLCGLTLLTAPAARADSGDENPPAAGQSEQQTKPTPAPVKGAGVEIDNWIGSNVDRSLSTMSGAFEHLLLGQPSLYGRSELWVWSIWGVGFAFGLLMVTVAYVWHAYHVIRGTDAQRVRSVLVRLSVPLRAMIYMGLAPIGYEALRTFQEWIWSADQFPRDNAGVILGVALPQVPQPPSQWWTPFLTEAAAIVPHTTIEIATTPLRAVLYPLRVAGDYLSGMVGLSNRVGGWSATAVGLAVLGVGILALIAYFVRGLLIGLTGFYLGLAALRDDPAPLAGWLDLLVRTDLLITVFNVAWLLMRYLPDWFSWMKIDAFWYTLGVMIILWNAVWRLWVRRIQAIVFDPVFLGGQQVMAGIGRLTGTLGQAVSVAGMVTGQPELATVGSAMTGWGSRTQARSETAQADVRAGRSIWWHRTESPVATPTPQVTPSGGCTKSTPAAARTAASPVSAGVAAPAQPRTASAPSRGPAGSGDIPAQPCWQDGASYVVVTDGLPVWTPSQPVGTYLAGQWTGHS